ncbi:GntR family transcriptional regulator [Rhodococcus marinonascens]|uniref:GntR family transcriptional regulator n=1 Tax=Rhodococcus marinonascens TaxID=38311 RepID=UPI001472AE27|nr:GntR family transcriptional regulator [Rhodococcus marinonascens]
MEIAAELRRRLGSAGAGDPLPSEAELSERYGVSRMTARQAVKSLEAEGLVYRVPGSGTYASGNEADRTMGILRSFTDDMAERGIAVISDVLFSDWVDLSPETAAELVATPGSRAVRVMRVRLGDGLPLALETVTLPPRCSFVLDYDLGTISLHRLLEDHGLILTEARGTVAATIADDNDAAHLRVAIGSPLLVENLRVEDQNGERVEATETRYVGSKYILDVQFRRQNRFP